MRKRDLIQANRQLVRVSERRLHGGDSFVIGACGTSWPRYATSVDTAGLESCVRMRDCVRWWYIARVAEVVRS